MSHPCLPLLCTLILALHSWLTPTLGYGLSIWLGWRTCYWDYQTRVKEYERGRFTWNQQPCGGEHASLPKGNTEETTVSATILLQFPHFNWLAPLCWFLPFKPSTSSDPLRTKDFYCGVLRMRRIKFFLTLQVALRRSQLSVCVPTHLVNLY